MKSIFQGRSFLAEKDFSQAELQYLIDFAQHLKEMKQQHLPHQYLAGKNIALLFEKTSTRTRAAFTVATTDLGAHPEFLGANDIQLGTKESVEDTAKVLGRMFDGLEYRGSSQEVVAQLAESAGVPVWNGLTDAWHPTQMIADFLTVQENFGTLAGLTIAYCGDGRNNVANSLLITSAILGVNIHIVTPKFLFPDDQLVALAKTYGQESGAAILITDHVSEGVLGADVIYTDVWVSMGEEAQFEARIKQLLPYQVNQQLINQTQNEQVIFMHCLPAFHDTQTSYGKEAAGKYGIKEMEVTDEVFRSTYARQFDQAENRLHAIKAIMAATAGNLFIPKV